MRCSSKKRNPISNVFFKNLGCSFANSSAVTRLTTIKSTPTVRLHQCHHHSHPFILAFVGFRVSVFLTCRFPFHRHHLSLDFDSSFGISARLFSCRCPHRSHLLLLLLHRSTSL